MIRKYRMSALIAAAGVILASAAVAQQVDASLEDARQTKPNQTNPAPRVGAQPPFTVEYESHLTVREDRTAMEISTKRIKILTSGAAQTISQQQLQFNEGAQTLEILEAFTEKSDGRRIPVDPANIITGGTASNLQATYYQDLKVRTIIFADVSVGDTLVLTSKLNTLQDVFPGQFTYFDLIPRTLPLSSVQFTIEFAGFARSGGQGDGQRERGASRTDRRGPAPNHNHRPGTLRGRRGWRGLAVRPRADADGFHFPFL